MNPRLKNLSARELEVFVLIGKSIGPRAIAKELGIGYKTVAAHKQNIKNKLGLTQRAVHLAAVRYMVSLPTAP